MNEEEKLYRCYNAECREISEYEDVQCRVYSRWVSGCKDCSFDTDITHEEIND